MIRKPCIKCGSDIMRINGRVISCSECDRYIATIVRPNKNEAAETAWDNANTIGQVDALEALQQAVAVVLMYRYGSNRAIWRDDIKLGYDRDCVDLLIMQGVLIETDGRITIK